MNYSLVSVFSDGISHRPSIPYAVSRRRKLSVCVAALVASASMMTADDVEAAPKKGSKNKAQSVTAVPDQSAEIAQLREKLQALQQENNLLKQGVVAAPAPAAPVTDSTVAASAATEPAAVVAEEVKNDEPYIDEPKNLSEVVVNARRKEEKLQDVPIPISIVSGEQMARENIVTVRDISRRVPNLTVTAPQPRGTSLSLRGLRNSASDNLEADVGVMVDNVYMAWTGSSWNNYTDIDHVEVLRGPQGTLQGKNNNLGLVNINTKLPSFKPGYSIDGFAGNRDSLQGKASATGPLIDGLLAYRAAFYIDRLNGQIENINPQTTPLKLQDTNELGGRAQLLFTPSDTLSARIIVNRSSAKQTMTVNPNLADPTTFADGSTRPITFSSRLARNWFDYQRNNGTPIASIGDPRKVALDNHPTGLADQQGASGEINWDVAGHKLTSVTAYHYGMYQGRHDYDYSQGDIGHMEGGGANNKQWSQEFRLASEKPGFGFIDYQVGLFALRSDTHSDNQHKYGVDAGAFYASNAQYNRLNATAVGREVMKNSLNGMTNISLSNPTTTSLAAFSQVNLHVTDAATLTLGLRDTWEHKDNSASNQNLGGTILDQAHNPGATAQNIADARAIKKQFMRDDWTAARQGFDSNSQNWIVNPSYKITADVMTYFSVGGGEKSGAAQFDNDGKIANVDPEKILDYELGVKSAWFDRKLTANLNLYQVDIKGFQAPLNLHDHTTSTGFKTQTGNIEGMQLRGIELDSAWQAYQGLSLFFNGSYSHSIYTDFKNAPCPPELSTSDPMAMAPMACDQTGMTQPNAPQFTANFGFDYHVPLGFGKWEDYGFEWHTFLVDSFKSHVNTDSNLSTIASTQPSYHVTDGGIGVGTINGKYTLDLVARNMFDTIYLTNTTAFNSTSAVRGTVGEARYFGVHFRGNF